MLRHAADHDDLLTHHEIAPLANKQECELDADLANLYGVTARRLNEQVRRNRSRFPDDFAFYLNINEMKILKSQFATSSWGGKRKPPLAVNEHGAIMAATVLKSPRAVEMSIYVAGCHDAPAV